MATGSKNCLCRNRKPVVRRLHRERAVRSLDSIFAALGEHYFYLYPPWAIATWWSKWHTNAPALFTQPLQLGVALAVILCLAYTIHVVTRWQSLREYSDIHGSARWAKLSDIKQAGLIH